MAGRVVVVTDSTAALTRAEADELGISVVPLHVVIDEQEHTEGVDIDPGQVVAALRKGRRVSTSRPSPMAMLHCYERLAEAGVSAVVSAHLSGQLSGTCDAAALAAREAPIPVQVVDSGSTGLALGYAVGAAARAPVEPRAEPEEIAGILGAEIERRCRATSVLCYVHSLDHLRRGGRIGAAASLLGGALAIKPLLTLSEGHIEPLEKLRTSGRALARLTDLGFEQMTQRSGGAERAGGVRVAVHHADACARAEAMAADLMTRAEEQLGAGVAEIQVRELPAVLAVHLGPGTVAVIVAPT